jgi:hypothetical protein
VLRNFTAGGLLGYCSSNCMTSLKVPSSKGVSAGPMMTAFLEVFHQSKVTRLAGRMVIPLHDIVSHWGSGNTGRRIGLHSLKGM